jgi:hypothetical protein
MIIFIKLAINARGPINGPSDMRSMSQAFMIYGSSGRPLDVNEMQKEQYPTKHDNE